MSTVDKESTGRTLLVAFVLCIVCSVIVAGAAVSLKPVQTSNKVLDRKKNILAAAGMFTPGEHGAAEIEELFGRFTVRMVDLDTGEYLSETQLAQPELNPERYDQVKAAKDPKLSEALHADDDIAGIRRREKFAQVYLLEDEGLLQKIVLPIRGYGLWSTLYGFLVLEGDASTVIGLAYYDQKETPGLGGEVDNPAWKALWPGKQVFDEQGAVAIDIVKGGVDKAAPEAVHQVDGLSGATLTSNGVENMLHFWLGERGFGPYLSRIRGGQA
jgi:Na+-transporting NADH:ubiquinone oxidoreductase subunit C